MKIKSMFIFCLFLSIDFLCFSSNLIQNTNEKRVTDTLFNFQIIDDEIIWSKVFEVLDSPKNQLKGKMHKFLTSNLNLQIVDSTEDEIRVKVPPHKLNYKKYGGSLLNMPLVLLKDEIQYNVFFYFKDGKYLCEVKNISFKEGNSKVFKSLDGNRTTLLESIAYNKNRKTFKALTKITFELMNEEFLDFFKYKDVKKKDF